ncbi:MULTISPECIES: hypothetical protein [Vibrio]|uniref:Uncharacterized protein n=1 Tax=Vibrio proteolyticus NBRC 13287 TaxID=1219065 RepID=U3A4F4_VIBPR|nr:MULTISPECIES: hypothetical protein [Vibrio]NAW58581.1 hypothetical protein [Vibrio sp. V36_P2S2PM302]NAX21389.1 hypothetical protein [Vibrio sp. V39_P1S14PM300]NAX27465.1 hypothetical protein [Vibrio sp. V38_P2S17PM301]NAX29968.1 hypothetical protein [Vibrio sp. V37_P2S8PM304]GAD68585.1 hypothetical protein VPR01S_17_00340 [Vibrio proteolyticus NBRC 13287]
MSRKLGRVMSGSRMITFVAFVTAVLAWVLEMPALFTVSVAALVVGGILFIRDKRRQSNDEKSA